MGWREVLVLSQRPSFEIALAALGFAALSASVILTWTRVSR